MHKKVTRKCSRDQSRGVVSRAHNRERQRKQCEGETSGLVRRDVYSELFQAKATTGKRHFFAKTCTYSGH